MKTIFVFVFLISAISILAQSNKINVLDENLSADNTVFIFERLDGSIFELNGTSNWTAHRVLPSSKAFSEFISAKKPLLIEFETIDGSQYSNLNGGNWNKKQRRFDPQGPMGFTAIYKQQQKLIEVNFKIDNQSLVEINLHEVYGANEMLLYKKYEQSGQHRIMLPINGVVKGEYVIVIRTPHRVESRRISIVN
ncbi:MAG: hypothetical protein MUE72_13815 [Chitinophagaceae bacterium]|jgi:hypothetical protein|nr:hypothetical protein [Chitinophagaceae bacterium]